VGKDKLPSFTSRSAVIPFHRTRIARLVLLNTVRVDFQIVRP